MPEPTRARYLATLDSLLPFPPERRAEIVEEIATHLDDVVAGGAAEADAQRRLGRPERLAEELARPEQSALRLLAAAGAGVRAAVGPWIVGYLLASVALLVGFLVVALLAGVLTRLLAVDVPALTLHGGWSTAVTAIPIALALYLGARSATPAASIAGRRLHVRVRPWVAIAGSAGSAGVLWFLVEVPHNAVSVTAWGLAPLAVVLGAYRPSVLPQWPPRALFIATLAIGFILPLLLVVHAVLGPTTDSSQGYPAENWEHRTELVAPFWPPGLETWPFEWSGWTASDDRVDAEWQLGSATSLDGFRNLRLEAWHSDPSAQWKLDESRTAPFATAPVRREGDMLLASIETARDPHVHGWELFLTGIGPDDRRYILDAPGGGHSSFRGTSVDWLVAVTR